MNITVKFSASPGALPRHHAGMSLLQVMLILLLLGAIVATGFQLLQSRATTTQTIQQAQALTWADQAVASFAAANSRLPCPASTPEGKEDCASGASKGYLPIASLDTFFDGNRTSIIGASGTGKLPGPVMYAVNRPNNGGPAAPYATTGASPMDLALASQHYRPHSYDGKKQTYDARPEFEVDGAKFYYDAVNGLDFCASLSQASASPSLTAGLSVPLGSRNSHIVAYGIAVAGATSGDIGRFDDDNVDNALTLADPGRTSSADYDDRVRVRTFESLAQSVGCNLLASRAAAAGRPAFADNVPTSTMDLLADSASIDDSVKGAQRATKKSAEEAVAGGKQAVAFATIAVVMAGVDVTSKIIDLAEGVGLLVQNIVRCVATFGAECWRLAPSGIALALNATALVQSVASLAQSLTSLAINSKALIDAGAVLTMAQAAIEASTTNDLSEALKQAHDAAYGDCSIRINPATGQLETVCAREGLKQSSEKLEETAKTLEADRDSYHANHIAPWEGDRLTERFPGWNEMDSKDRSSSMTALINALQSTRDYIDGVALLDFYSDHLKNYREQLAKLEVLVADQVATGLQTGDDKSSCEAKPTEPEKTLCRAQLKQCADEPTDLDRLKCEGAASGMHYIATCMKNGAEDKFKPTSVTGQLGSNSSLGEMPFCIPALKAGIEYADARVKEQTKVVKTLLARANHTGATKKPVLLGGGTPAQSWYLEQDDLTKFRYPGSWTFCTDEMKANKICGVNVFDPVLPEYYAQFGGYLPLLNLSGGVKWVSYGDAYRQYAVLKANAEKARTTANSTREQFWNAVKAYEELKSIVTSGTDVSGSDLWLGANQTVKAADDRGTVGPDRNADAQSQVSP